MFNWKLKDIIMVCIFSIVFSFIYLYTLYAANFFTTILSPFGLSQFAYEVVFGIWFMASTFSAYIIRKKGVAIISEILAGTIEVLMGNIFGPIVIISAFIQGLGCELIFMKYKYKNFTFISMSLAASLACIFSFVWGYFRGAYDALSIYYIVCMFGVRMISAIFFAGILSKILADKLSNTGALSSYDISNK